MNQIIKYIYAGLLVFLVISPTSSLANVTQDELLAVFKESEVSAVGPEQTILSLVGKGLTLDQATEFTITRSTQATAAAAYTRTGICLAQDEWVAQTVAQTAIESASETSINEVQNSATKALAIYGTGGCQGIVETRRGAQLPFGGIPGSGSAVSTDQ